MNDDALSVFRGDLTGRFFVDYVCRRRSSATLSSCMCWRNDTFTRGKNTCTSRATTRTCLHKHRSVTCSRHSVSLCCLYGL